MPPRKAPATTKIPAASAKALPRQLGTKISTDHSPREDVHTSARTSRTQDYMASARAREAELEKRGYCF